MSVATVPSGPIVATITYSTMAVSQSRSPTAFAVSFLPSLSTLYWK